MKILSSQEYSLYESICKLTQDELLHSLPKILRKYGYKKIKETKDYIIAEGKIPILLCAHLDTVGTERPNEFYYDQRKGVIWSPQLAGADDRAGIYAILNIIRSGLRPCICFTTEEEKGGLGAMALAKDGWPYNPLKFILQLDRRNSGEVVYYDMDDTLEFCKYIESFGFVEAFGTFSDVSELAPAFGVAGCNLSVGYVDEHTPEERLFVSGLLYTIDRVKKILSDTNSPWTTYFESPSAWENYAHYYNLYGYGPGSYDNIRDNYVYCDHCKKLVPKDETLQVQMLNDQKGNFCIDCLSDDAKIRYCARCSNMFEADPKDPYQDLCPDCRRKLDEYRHKLN